MIDIRAFWWPVATSGDLRAGRVLARTLCDVPLALFRDGAGRARAHADRCPHRGAPLSAGRVVGGEVECGYHGWRFDGDGRRTCVPGLPVQATTSRPLCDAVAAEEAGGLVWACLAPDGAPPIHLGGDGGRDGDAFFITDRVSCDVAAAAENFLDGSHTHFVHPGLVRRASERQTVTVRVRAISGGVEAIYRGESRQSGWLSRLFEPERTESMGRFYLPGIAEVEYRNARGLTLMVTAWLTPETPETLRVFARVVTPRRFWPAWAKTPVLRQLFGAVFRQDKRILERTSANALRFDSSRHLDSPLDVLAPHIRQLLAGNALAETLSIERQLLL